MDANSANSSNACPICKVSFGMENAEVMMYIDYRMWEYTKQGFFSLVFYSNALDYNVDVNEINHAQLKQALMTQNRVMKVYPQTTPSF